MMDFIFLEFYIKKKYGIKVDEYFDISRASISQWRETNEVPSKRILQFNEKEGSIDMHILFSKLYT